MDPLKTIFESLGHAAHNERLKGNESGAAGFGLIAIGLLTLPIPIIGLPLIIIGLWKLFKK